jgi:hypothetical protein
MTSHPIIPTHTCTGLLLSSVVVTIGSLELQIEDQMTLLDGPDGNGDSGGAEIIDLSVIQYLTGQGGAAVAREEGELVFDGCVFEGNTATEGGTFAALARSHITTTNSVVRSSQAMAIGGGS